MSCSSANKLLSFQRPYSLKWQPLLVSDVSEIQLAICRREAYARELFENAVPTSLQQPVPAAVRGIDSLRRTISKAQEACPEAAMAIIALLELRVRDHVQINEMLELDAQRLLDDKEPEGALWDAD